MNNIIEIINEVTYIESVEDINYIELIEDVNYIEENWASSLQTTSENAFVDGGSRE